MGLWFVKFWNALLALFGLRRKQSELNEEVDFHIEERASELLEQGYDIKTARDMALREFGGIETCKEDCRDAWGTRFIHEIWSDLRQAWRQINKHLGYSIIVVSILSLCIAANTSIFSMLYNAVLKPYPYPEEERLVELGEVRLKTDSGDDILRISIRKYLDYKELDVFENIGLYRFGGDNLHFGDQAFRVTTGRVSPSFLETLQVRPILGRNFIEGEDEEGRPGVVILSYDLWQTAFDSDRGVLGKRVDIEGMTFEIIGVMPASFRFLDVDVSLWRPHIVSPNSKTRRAWNANRLTAIARLKEGVSMEQAQTALKVSDRHTYETYAGRRDFIDRVGWGSALANFRSYNTQDGRDVLFFLQASVIGVFLIGCANIANMVFSKTTVRMQEISMRISLGAQLSRLARMLLVEGVMYGVIAGLIGLVLGLLGLEIIKEYGLYLFSRPESLSVDGVSLVYNFSLAIAGGLAIGLAPLLLMRQRDLAGSLRESGRSSTASRSLVRLRQVMAMGQVALTCILLIATGLMLSSLKKILDNETGFETENLVSAMLELPNASEPHEQLDYGERLIQRLSELSEVRSVALNSFVPFFGFFGLSSEFFIEGRRYSPQNRRPRFSFGIAHGPIFETVGIPLIRGRTFTEGDMMFDAPPVVIIDKRLADLYFPNEDPIGKRLTGDLAGDFAASEDATWATIVGVVGNVKTLELNEEGVNPMLYMNAGARPIQAQRIVMRVSGGERFNLEAFEGKVRAAMSEVDATVPSTEFISMEERIDGTLLGRRATLRFLAGFGGLALLLSAIGIYGILSYSVTLRRKEFGVRTALGASRHEILRTVLFQGLRVTGIGLAVGLVLAGVVTQLIQERLYRTGSFDFGVYSGVALVLVVVAFFASFIPALRAANTNAASALHSD